MGLMPTAADKILSTVNAPYAKKLSAHDLAQAISADQPASQGLGQALSFFSELPPDLQIAFVEEMHLDLAKVTKAAAYHYAKSGHTRFPIVKSNEL